MAAHRRILIATNGTDVGWQRETLLGIREYAAGRPWTLLVQLRAVKPKARTLRNIDGSILDLTDASYYRGFVDLSGPKVSYSDCMAQSPLPRVTMDNLQAGRLAAQHFMERNIRNLAFLGIDRGEHYGFQRQAGFLHALEGKEIQFSSIPQTDVQEDEGRAFREWLERTPKPVGLLAIDDDLARSIAECCMEWEAEVPGQVLILGFNNDIFRCEFCQPSLSSVIMPSRAIGYKAAEILDTLMQGRRLAQNEFLIPSPGIAERVSTQTVAFGCPELDRALRFIRKNAAQPIGVKQVIEYAAAPKRSLEQLFADHLGHGPGEELRRTRLALAKFYLTTTKRPIAEVAALSGFSSTTHLGLVMQRYEKQTPFAYRRCHASVAG